MGILTASIVIGPRVRTGALPVAARQWSLAPGWGAILRLAADGDSTTDRDTFTQEARDEIPDGGCQG